MLWRINDILYYNIFRVDNMEYVLGAIFIILAVIFITNDDKDTYYIE